MKRYQGVIDIRESLEQVETTGLYREFSSIPELENHLRQDLGLYLQKHFPPPAGNTEASPPPPAPKRNADELADLPITTGIGIPDQPYKSLTWFTSDDARIFFGRTTDIKELYRKLDNKYIRVVAFFGQSGAGKSSLLHAGILPRLPKIWTPVYKRRTQDGNATEILNGAKRWLEREKPAHPLLILDQLEEMYTNPDPDLPGEAAQFPILLRELSDSYPSMRIVLGFRSDRWAEIEDLLKEGGISVLPHFLKVLDHRGIHEAMAGVMEQKDLVDRFRGLSLAPGEDDLPVRIANDLMSHDDSRANAAPLLQFILRRMWDEVSADPAETPVFSWALYERHRRASMLDLLDKQLEEMPPSLRKEVENGLALDLLRGFVTEESTAGAMAEDALLQSYAHRPPQLIKDLCRELGNRYLLTSFSGSSKTLHWRLAHDALAPAVLRRFTESDAPGQRARRIIESKYREKNAAQVAEQITPPPLSQPDLHIIKEGRNGMPTLSQWMEWLIKDCTVYYEKEQREKEENKKKIAENHYRNANLYIRQLVYDDAYLEIQQAVRSNIWSDKLSRILMEITFVDVETGQKDRALNCLKYLRDIVLYEWLPESTDQLEKLDGQHFQKEVHQILQKLNGENFREIDRRYFPDMVPVEGGTMQMGFEKGEEKGHKVTVDSFQIARTQVTWWQYYLYCRATGREMPAAPGWGRIGNHPVVNVSWYDAVEYANWVSERRGYIPVYEINKERKDPNNKNGYDDQKWTVTLRKDADGLRLPTEAEWEFAARGGNPSKGFVYSGSDNIDEAGWHSNNAESKTHPVAEKKANELGLYDMSGNVDEWCWDWHGDYPSAAQTNPTGPASGSVRVFRGGSWDGDADGCRVAVRHWYDPDYRGYDTGFRPARTVSL
ncbi:MAG: SUMF1/EgtB/PvdO family nonheme iron enzyme [Saprospiraceae bacterium]